MNDCEMCLLGASYRSKIDSSVKVIFLFESGYREEKDFIVSKFGIDTIKDMLIFSDTLYKKFNSNYSSTIHVFIGEKEYATFPLKKIDRSYYLISHPDTVPIDKLPPVFEYKMEENIIVLFNKSKSELLTYNLNDFERKIQKITISNDLTKFAFNKHFNDTISYHLFYDSLKNKNIPAMVPLKRIFSFDMNHDTLFILSSHMYDKLCIYKGQPDTCFFSFYTIYKVFHGKLVEVIPVKRESDGTILSYDNTRLSILGTKLNCLQGNYYINLTKGTVDFDTSDGFICKLKEYQGSLSYVSPIKLGLPELLVKYPFAFATDYSFHFPYVFPFFSTQIYNLENLSTISFPIQTGELSQLSNHTPEYGNPIKIPYRVIDFAIKDNQIKLLVMREGKVYISSFDLKSQAIVDEKFIYAVKDLDLRTDVKFQDFETIILFPQKVNYFVRLKI